jgi:hypothetical protein
MAACAMRGASPPALAAIECFASSLCRLRTAALRH